MKKVAIIHDKLKKTGGMESYLLDLINGFSKHGASVHLFTYKVDEKLSGKIPCVVHHTPLWFLPRRMRKYAFIHKINQSFDLSQFDLSISLNQVATANVGVCGGTHPGYINTLKRNIYKKIHDNIQTYFERKMLQSVPHVVAHSCRIAEEIKQYFVIDQKKIKTIYPPVNTEYYHQAYSSVTIQAIKDKYNINKQSVNIIFPSGGHVRKGLLELLPAFSQLGKHYQLYIAGRKPKQSLPDNVHYIGYVNNLAPVYAAMDYTILPSHYEPFGLVVAESIACGTPVIVGPSVGAAELLSNGNGVIMQDNQPTTIVRTLNSIPHRSVSMDGQDFVKRHGLFLMQHIEKLWDLRP